MASGAPSVPQAHKSLTAARCMDGAWAIRRAFACCSPSETAPGMVASARAPCAEDSPITTQASPGVCSKIRHGSGVYCTGLDDTLSSSCLRQSTCFWLKENSPRSDPRLRGCTGFRRQHLVVHACTLDSKAYWQKLITSRPPR